MLRLVGMVPIALMLNDDPQLEADLAHPMTTAGRVPWGHWSEGFLEANEDLLQSADAPILASLIIADFIRFTRGRGTVQALRPGAR